MKHDPTSTALYNDSLLWYVFYSSYYHTEFICQSRSVEDAELSVLVFQRVEGLDDPAKDWELLSIHENAPIK